MKRKVFIITILLTLLSIGVVYAGFRVDIGITVPAYLGVVLETGEEVGEDILQYAIVVPDLQFYYIFDLGIVNLGAGIRAYTILIETLMMPSLVAEVELGSFLIHGSVFGGTFFVFGLYSDIGSAKVGAIDVNVSYKFREWFGLGVGVMVFGEYDPDIYMGDTPFVLYAFGKFSFSF